MLRRLIVLVFVFVGVSLAYAIEKKEYPNVEMQVLVRAPDKEAIIAWGKQQRSNCGVFQYTHNSREIIVLLIDTASGQWHDDIYICERLKEHTTNWILVLYRPTDVEVKVQEKDGKLVFTTETNDVILEQSLDAIGPFGDMVRRKWEEAEAAKRDKFEEMVRKKRAEAKAAKGDNDKSEQQSDQGR